MSVPYFSIFIALWRWNKMKSLQDGMLHGLVKMMYYEANKLSKSAFTRMLKKKALNTSINNTN